MLLLRSLRRSLPCESDHARRYRYAPANRQSQMHCLFGMCQNLPGQGDQVKPAAYCGQSRALHRSLLGAGTVVYAPRISLAKHGEEPHIAIVLCRSPQTCRRRNQSEPYMRKISSDAARASSPETMSLPPFTHFSAKSFSRISCPVVAVTALVAAPECSSNA